MILNSTAAAALAQLQAKGYKLTRSRREIIDALFGRCRAVTAAELHSLLADPAVSLATVYRTLETLVEIGVVETVAHPGDERQYLACSLEHHHHVICTQCGRVELFDECLIGPLQELVEARTNFAIDEHTLEFKGRCAACKASSRLR